MSTILECFLSYSFLVRAIARVLKWLPSRVTNYAIYVDDVREAETRLLVMIQREQFPIEYKILTDNQDKGTSKTTRLDSLTLFVDVEGLIRVVGHLQKANLNYEAKHPILLPYKHHLTSLIVNDYNVRNLHAGAQFTLCLTRECFWIVNGCDRVNCVIGNCLTCRKIKPKRLQVKMSSLPTVRVTEAYSFESVVVYFFGHTSTKEKKFRNKPIIKLYECIFVYMVSKAVHIKIVSELSTIAFLAAFRRLITRRDIPSDVHSNNGTNFVGASNNLTESYDFIYSDLFKRKVSDFALSKRINRHFSPPMSPHFGGLWEPAVKKLQISS